MEEFEKMAAIELEEPEPDDANELTANGASQLDPNRILDQGSEPGRPRRAERRSE
jgi:hypothetical protein